MIRVSEDISKEIPKEIKKMKKFSINSWKNPRWVPNLEIFSEEFLKKSLNKNPKWCFERILGRYHGEIPKGFLGGNPGGNSEKVHKEIPDGVSEEILVWVSAGILERVS